MPNFDQTGPNGQGPMTGRGFGNCPRPNRFMRGFQKFCPFWRNNQFSNVSDKETIKQEIEDTKEYLKELEEEKKNIEKE